MSSQVNIKSKHVVNFIWIGLFFSGVYWVLESVRDVIAFEKGSLVQRIFAPESMSLWMRIMVICIIMAFSAIIQSMRQKAEAKDKDLDFLGKGTIILLSLVFGLIYWILEAIRDVFIYNRGSLLQQIFKPDPLGFWMRIFAICMLVLFGAYVKTLIEDRQKAKDMLKTIRDSQIKDLERKIKEMELEREDNQKKIKSKKWEEEELRELLRQKSSYIRTVHQSSRTHLQHLCSLLDIHIMQAEQETQRKLYTEIRVMIYSLILMHMQLHQSDRFNQVNLSEYLTEIANYFFHAHLTNEIQIHIDNPHILIPISQAVPFAFVISEILFLANKKRELYQDSDRFQILIKRTDDSALSVKIRHKDAELLPDIEKDKIRTEYQWFRELIDVQLRGDFWTVRNTQGIDMNIVFKLKT
ncbi:hypothetical protein JW835_02995 [bacterium]|nr:hypothetical protein [bacterium]